MILLAAILAQTLLAAILCFVPLFDLLGYEYSFAVGLLGAVTGLAIGLWVGDRADRGLTTGCARAVALAVGHLLPGLLLISLNALRVRNCDPGAGLSFFVYLPVATVTYASLLGVAVGRIIPVGRRGIRALAGTAVVVAPLLACVFSLLTEPPVFVYDHLLGYFAGSLYDEAITVTGTLRDFRAATLLRCGALVIFIYVWDRRPWLGRLPVMLTAALVIGIVAADSPLGATYDYRVDRADIEDELSVRVERPGLVIHLPAGTGAEQQDAVADDHAFRLAQLQKKLRLPAGGPPINSYVYRDARQKARLMGGANTQVAKPWLREIHIHGVSPRHPVLAHELVHVLAAQFGSPALGLSFTGALGLNLGLIEGLAEGLTRREGALDLDTYAKAMRDLGLAPDVRNIIGSGGFWRTAPRRAYTVAGSFVRYLLETFGVERLEAVYPTGDFLGVYGKSLDVLVSGWEEKIDAREILPRDRRDARERFRRPSIFARPCAHVIADLRRRANSADPDRAVRLHRRICRHLGNTPSARGDLAKALLRANREPEYIALTDALLADPSISVARKVPIYEERGDLSWGHGKIDEARAMFRTALGVRVSLASERLQWVRLWALDLAPADRNTLRLFLGHKLDKAVGILDLDAIAHALPDDRTLPYLIGRQYFQLKLWDRALERLAAAAGHSFGPIEAERVRLVARINVERAQWDAARDAYRAYAAAVPVSGERARAADELERIDFLATTTDDP